MLMAHENNGSLTSRKVQIEKSRTLIAASTIMTLASLSGCGTTNTVFRGDETGRAKAIPYSESCFEKQHLMSRQ
ncbi:hypothetical protein [Pseudomonas gingeri]|uniref:hypothetical protein n=1 Tax=Pseudomonas gingeri TaxID=117681 RepID=UPI0015A22C38|nr:hypothetical protein [Pseudomonas gingeri]NWE26803.1 hypothetical protein [Pseudomonas gingeri]NWE94857.1 hypothetical protein [Pseudomonas gingeri]